MRKLIIIGNGFDKAHGLDTDYGSFVKWYLVEQVIKFFENNYQPIKNELVILEKGARSLNNFDDVKKQGKVYNFLKREMVKPDFLKFNFNSNLFKRIYERTESDEKDLRWVDIENEYFQALKVSSNSNITNLKSLNKQFSEIRLELIKYLIEEQSKKTTKGIPFSEQILDSFYGNNDTEYFFLIFNYTNTVDKYVNSLKNTRNAKVKTNYIHGSLGGEPIFGIGNEYHEDYVLFKKNDSRFKQLLKYSKSQWYLRNENYSNLAKFLNETVTINGKRYPSEIEVSIYGHSCGSSDTTLLRHIFQHQACKSIKVFYKDLNSYYHQMLDLERYFEDPLMFREKVRSLEVCEPMPQPKDE